MPRSRWSRKSTQLFNSGRLNSYAIAAGAAGVSLAALAGPAEAKIVYTPAMQHIFPGTTVGIDLNADGKIDFNIHASFSCTSFCEYEIGELKVIPTQKANQVWGHAAGNFRYASAVSAGIVLGAGTKFAAGLGVMARGGYDAGTNTVGYCVGPWVNVSDRYLGFRFAVGGQVHYGWARLTETCKKNGRNSAVLTGYAYETTPFQAITAGQTTDAVRQTEVHAAGNASLQELRAPLPSLGVLAYGARGLALWRREEPQA